MFLAAAMLLAAMITDTGNAQILIPDPPAIVAENPVAENRMIAKAIQPLEIQETQEVVGGVVRDDQEVDLDETAETAPEEVGMEKYLYGVCTITHYCGCSACCGAWGNATASGATPTPNHTVATNTLPFGTRLLINGQEYVCEDRGDANMDAFWVDIYCDSHEEALRRGMYQSEVWIIDE